MSPSQIPALLPVIVPIIVVAVLVLRMRPGREVRVRPGALWVMPLLLGSFIGSGLWFLPKPTPTPAHVAILVAATLAGIAFGWWRAGKMNVRRDGEQVLVSTSALAFLVIIGLLVVRQLLRFTDSGPASAVATDAGMVFALGLIITSRAALWLRIRRLPAHAV